MMLYVDREELRRLLSRTTADNQCLCCCDVGEVSRRSTESGSFPDGFLETEPDILCQT